MQNGTVHSQLVSRLGKKADYGGIVAGTIFGSSLRVTHEGSAHHLKHEALEKDLLLHVSDNTSGSNMNKECREERFNRFLIKVQKDRAWEMKLPDEVRLELYGLFA